MTETDKAIIKALKKGISLGRIAKETGVPKSTIHWRIRHNKEYKLAYNLYKTMVENMFQ